MEEKEKDEELKFVDRRRVKEEDVSPQVEAPPEKEERKEEKVEEEKRVSDEETPEYHESVSLENMDIPTLTKWFLGILAGSAWSNLGIASHPKSGEVKRDLKQARQAIDLIDLIFKGREDFFDELEKKEVNSLLANLRIAFVEQSKLL